MTYFGETLRKAREAKGLTTSQVAEKTRILVQIIDAMEKEDFSRIKAAIYGRGFVKLICECLGIDPKPLVAEFMDIYEGRRPPVAADVFQPKPPPPPPQQTAPAPAAKPEPAIVSAATPEPAIVSAADSESQIIPAATPETPASPISTAVPAAPEVPSVPTVPAAPPPPETPPAQPTPEVPESVKGLDLFDPQPTPISKEPPTATRAQDIFASAYSTPEPEVHAGPSATEKFKTGLSVVSHGVIGSVRRIPRSAWRMAVLAIGAGVVIALLAWGCVILYRVTEHPVMDTDEPTTPTVARPSATQTTPPAAKPAAPAAKPATKAPNAPKANGPAPNAPKAVNGPKTSKGDAKPQPMRSTGQKVPPLYVD